MKETWHTDHWLTRKFFIKLEANRNSIHNMLKFMTTFQISLLLQAEILQSSKCVILLCPWYVTTNYAMILAFITKSFPNMVPNYRLI